MKQKIGTKLYDTECAELIHAFKSGSWGDPEGYEEKLYRTNDGFYFIWGKGGEKSPYPTERIKRLSKPNAAAYLSKWN